MLLLLLQSQIVIANNNCGSIIQAPQLPSELVPQLFYGRHILKSFHHTFITFFAGSVLVILLSADRICLLGSPLFPNRTEEVTNFLSCLLQISLDPNPW